LQLNETPDARTVKMMGTAATDSGSRVIRVVTLLTVTSTYFVNDTCVLPDRYSFMANTENACTVFADWRVLARLYLQVPWKSNP
jgi:hypothetical protein